jgi:hypothetical protein
MVARLRPRHLTVRSIEDAAFAAGVPMFDEIPLRIADLSGNSPTD